jgi:hypothetical protein
VQLAAISEIQNNSSKQLGGESDSTEATDLQLLDLSQVIDLLNSLSEKVNAGTDRLIEEFKETYGPPYETNLMQFHQCMLLMSERSPSPPSSISICAQGLFLNLYEED